MSSPSPITEAQLEANRNNAQKSSGPRTSEGKNRARLNGLRHGLTGQTVVMPFEDQKAWERHLARITESLHPETDLERGLAGSIANDQWRLNRARAIEENIFALGQTQNPIELKDADQRTNAALTQAQTFLDDAKQIGLLTLYESRINRTLQRNMTELNRLQTERRAAHQQALEEAMLLAQLALSKGQSYDPARDFPGNGFGFSATQLNALIDRKNRLEEARALAKQSQNPNTPLRKAA